jgi:hypothetical protein
MEGLALRQHMVGPLQTSRRQLENGRQWESGEPDMGNG